MLRGGKIGQMDRLITIQENVGTLDHNNQKVPSWQNVSTGPEVWAMKQEKTGNETYESDQLVAIQATFWTIRYRSDITPKHRIVYNGKNYDILSQPVELGRQQYLEIKTELIE